MNKTKCWMCDAGYPLSDDGSEHMPGDELVSCGNYQNPWDMKPILYFDIDGVMLSFNVPLMLQHNSRRGVKAHGAEEFLKWAEQHFELRPLTMWCLWGKFKERSIPRLVELIGMTPEWWGALRGMEHSCSQAKPDKSFGIDWDAHRAGREWVWIDDELGTTEREVLVRNGALNNHIRCDTSKRPNDLEEVKQRLIERFQLE